MEISSFLRFRPSARQVVVVSVVTIIAAGAAAFVAHRSAASYKAKAIVLMAQLFPPNTPNYSISPFVDDFQTILTTPKIVAETATVSGESTKKIQAGLTSTSVGSTLDVEVDYSSTHAAGALSVVKNSSRFALGLLAQDRLTADQGAATQASRDFAAATAALATYQFAHGADGSVEFNSLSANADRTRIRAATAADQVSDDQLQVLAARSNQTLSLEGPTKQSRLTGEIQAAASTGVIVGAITVLLVLAIGWRRRPVVSWRADPSGRSAPELSMAEPRVLAGLVVSRIDLGGMPCDLVDRTGVEQLLRGAISGAGPQPLLVASANLDKIFRFGHGRPHEGFFARSAARDRWLVLLDGAPVASQATRLTGVAWPRLAGSDLLPWILDTAAAEGARVGFLGGAASTHAHLRSVAPCRWPGLKIAGTWTPGAEDLDARSAELAREVRRGGDRRARGGAHPAWGMVAGPLRGGGRHPGRRRVRRRH